MAKNMSDRCWLNDTSTLMWVGVTLGDQLSALIPAGLPGLWRGNVTTSPGGPLVLDFTHKRY